MAHTQTDHDPQDGWPYDCVRCGTTVYDDGVHCADCARTLRTAGPSTGALPVGIALRRWMRRQSYPRFLAVVVAVASVEVGLTAAWLWLLYVAPVAPSWLPLP